MYVKKIMFRILLHAENGKNSASIMYDSAIICDEVMDADENASAEAKSKGQATSYDKTKFNENKATCKTQNFYVLLAFSSITIAILIAVSIYYFLIKYRAKQLLPFYYTNNELTEVLY